MCTMDWIELPSAGPPVIAGDGAMTLTIYNNSGVQKVDIELDKEALFSANPPTTYACSNSRCGAWGTRAPVVGLRCDMVEGPGSCTYPNTGCPEIYNCVDSTCGVSPEIRPSSCTCPGPSARTRRTAALCSLGESTRLRTPATGLGRRLTTSRRE
jgi:hypothetical protein